ncbi:hypothetical protein ANCCAN_07750 [Ancylostoma caninum]|uniref:Uncharacterized protein n=1 Tax=Ancylostoma caninum TaxID=29170 RepID=A0A368GPF2_ANCCA|nr:hypothetical protein ANCCAN_07750 [Ancylostoma caninum]
MKKTSNSKRNSWKRRRSLLNWQLRRKRDPWVVVASRNPEKSDSNSGSLPRSFVLSLNVLSFLCLIKHFICVIGTYFDINS